MQKSNKGYKFAMTSWTKKKAKVHSFIFHAYFIYWILKSLVETDFFLHNFLADRC